jgi:catecholate siderophore receptor
MNDYFTKSRGKKSGFRCNRNPPPIFSNSSSARAFLPQSVVNFSQFTGSGDDNGFVIVLSMNDKQTRQLALLILTNGLAATARAQSTNLPPATAGNTNAPTQLPDIIVTGQRQSYKTDAVTLPQLTQPLLDTPQSVTVIPREVLDDQNATTLRDALKNVSGISIAAGEGNLQGDNLTLRGFSAQDDIFLDGMRDTGDYYRDPFNYERIDVLEGPESVMFGRGSTGGIVNQESKTPELDPFVAGTLSFGTDLTRRGTVDVNEPVPQLGKNTAFRLNMMGNDSDVAGRDVTENQRYGFAPSLTFGLGALTQFTLSYLHQSENDIPDYGMPWLKFTGETSHPADVPHNNYYGFKDDHFNADVDMVTAKLEHDFNDAVTLNDQIRFANYSRDFRVTEPQVTNTVAAPPDTLSVKRNELAGDGTQTFLWDQVDLTTKFKTAFIDHTLVTGIEGGRETADETRFTDTPDSSGAYTSLMSPDENQYFSGSSAVRSDVNTVATSFGFYALDTMKFGEHWELSGGARWDYFDANYHSAAVGATPAASYDQLVTKPSWRGALVYKPVENGSIYFDYGTSWNPSAETLSLSAATAATPPEENETFELGTKWDFFHDRLSVRGSIFRTEKTNAREPDPNDPTLDVLGGDQRVDGVELAVSGYLTKNWEIFASYDYLDGEVVSSKNYPLAVGQPLNNVPKNTFSLWTTYDLPWRFEIGAGVDYVSSRFANSATYTGATPLEEAPDFYVVNALLKYKINKHISCQVNINNLTDQFYYAQLHPGHAIPGPGISALFSTSFKF